MDEIRPAGLTTGASQLREASVQRTVGPEERKARSVQPRDKQPHDEVSLSPQAQAVQLARNAVEQAPDVRQGKVDELKRQIAGGQYQIDRELLARRIVDTLA